MKRFLEMIELARREGVVVGNGSGGYETVQSLGFYKTVEECQPFVFSLSKETKIPKGFFGGMDDEKIELDAPFKVFSIEMMEGDVTIPTPFDEIRVFTHCILAYEHEPKVYRYFVYSTTFVPGSDKPISKVFRTDHMDGVVSDFIKRINSERTGREKVRDKIKIGIGQEKRFHTFRSIIHIRPKSDQIAINPGTRRPVEWTQRWFVRGHWRKHDGIGKDREGVYKVQGNTWVSEHSKGPDGLPMIRKVRVVSETS